MWTHGSLILRRRYTLTAFWAATAGIISSGITSALAQGGPLPPAPVTITPDTAPAAINNMGMGTATRFIRVTGYGIARAKPTDARLVFLVSTTRPSGLAAMKYSDLEVQQVRRGLQAGGVPQENISVSPARLISPPPSAPVAPILNPAGAQGPGPETPVDTAPTGGTGSPEGVPTPQPPQTASTEPQFTANARVEVITHEVNDVNGIEQIAMNAGATGVIGLTLELQPQKMAELKQLAIIAAMKDAANKAEILALGVKVKVLYAMSASELAAAPEPSNSNIAPVTEISLPFSIELVYAIG